MLILSFINKNKKSLQIKTLCIDQLNFGYNHYCENN